MTRTEEMRLANYDAHQQKIHDALVEKKASDEDLWILTERMWGGEELLGPRGYWKIGVGFVEDLESATQFDARGLPWSHPNFWDVPHPTCQTRSEWITVKKAKELVEWDKQQEKKWGKR